MTEMQIDWDAASFESGEDERARREREAMEALNARLAERDAQRGFVPTSEAVFPPDLMPPAQAPQRPLPAPPEMLAAPTPGDLGPSSPPPNPSPLDPGPPAISTSPQPPEPTAEASTNPEAQTSTAGAQAANLRRQGPQQPAPGSVDELMAQERRRMEQEQALQRPTSVHAQPPTAAMPGPTGLPSTRTAPLAPISGQTGIETGAAPAMAAMQAQRDEPTFDERREMAREEDVRRRRIRGILMGLAGLMGMRTIGSGGSMGGALPGLIAAGMVRRPDEEETLLEGDERSREIGAQEAEQASVTERLRLQREQADREAAERQQRLLLDVEKFRSEDADRSIRTGLAVNADRREEAMVDPTSGESIGRREMVRRYFTTLPREMQASINAAGGVEGLNAADASEYAELIRSNLNARVMSPRAQGDSAANAAVRAGRTGPVEGLDTAPENFVNLYRQRYNDPEVARAMATRDWLAMSEEDRRARMRDGELDKFRTVRFAGYEQTTPGSQLSSGLAEQAQSMAVDEARLEALRERAQETYAQIRNLSIPEQVRAWAASELPIQTHPAYIAFNAQRNSGIGILNRTQTGSSLDASERTNWDERISKPDSLLDILTGRAGQQLDQELAEAQADLRARIEALGYRRTDGSQEQSRGQRRAPTRRFRRPDGTIVTVRSDLSAEQREVAIRRALAAEWEEVTQ